MRKRYRLRKKVKMILLIAAFVIAYVTLLIYGIDRIQRINDGELIVISESCMD